MRPLLVAIALLMPAALALAEEPARPTHAWPGADRSALVLPAELWDDVLPHVGCAERPFGFHAEELRHFGRDRLLLRTVDNLFRDASRLPRFSGKLGDDLLAAANPVKPDLAEILRVGFGLVDTSAARFLPPPGGADWGVTWIPVGATPDEALELCLRSGDARSRFALDAVTRARWRALPEEIRRLVARLLVAAEAGRPAIRNAFAHPVLAAALEGTSLEERYRLASAPWSEEDDDPLAAPSPASFAMLEALDRDSLAQGALVHAIHVGAAIDEWRALAATPRGATVLAALPSSGFSFASPVGPVRILGTRDDDDPVPAALTVDLGGDDRHEGRHGVPWSLDAPVGLVVDLAGDDAYDGTQEPIGPACGLFGIGAIADLAGDDTYSAMESGEAAAWYGAGWIADYAGDDRYRMERAWGQAAAHAGVALLVDFAGDDLYDCPEQAQGMGSTLGAGLLVDVAGNDRYLAREDGNVEAIYLYQSVAMAQGCGYGRRADIGDGHSLAGGFGVLVDGAGDDRYEAQVWAQGAAYWWSAGIVEDRGGNDVWCNGKYSCGAGAHFAMGIAVDAAGDDAYNEGNDTAVNQYQGHARDGSIGVFVDGDGDDRYVLHNHCAGSADLDSLALFWDRRGDDAYVSRLDLSGPPNGWNETPGLGSATWYVPYRNFRDDLPTAGVFLDTGGRDSYSLSDRCRDDRAWTFFHEPASWGFGRDLEWWIP